MTPEEILKHVRQLIADHAGGDPDKRFYANRYVFARLQLDERKTKTDIKKRLLDAGQPCPECGLPFKTRKNVCIHRVNDKKGYSDGNCVLMHPDCHERFHSKQQADGLEESDDAGILVKKSKRHENRNLYGRQSLYWWDITPNLADSLRHYTDIQFVQKDTGQACTVPPMSIKAFLTPDRQTSRGSGNWGIHVLADAESQLALEPGEDGGNWLMLPLTLAWLDPEDGE